MQCLLRPPGPRFELSWSLNCAVVTSGGSPCATRGRLLSRRGGQLERFCVWVVPEASLVSEEPGLGWSVSAMCLPSGHSLTGGEDGRGAMLSTTGQGGK